MTEAATGSLDETLAATHHGDTGAQRDPVIARFERGDSVGRYIISSRLGSGGMGVVYAAYDPELDRRVALKLLHARGGPAASKARRSLLREAQALAKLSHPNVITVHDVGVHQERIFLAMEFIEGQTLGKWLASPRSWSEVVDVLVQAGHGLMAAHDKGLEHRDFKPENVIIGADGRVRVLDFGLARPASGGEVSSEPGDFSPRDDALSTEQTAFGKLVGTPAYMAPEQFEHSTTDARTDQFAYCVTLWEGLFGQRPFGGDNLAAIVAEVMAGKPRSPPKTRRVPSWLLRVLTRGLERAPERRFDTMEALLVALEAGRRRARSRRWLTVAGLGAGTLAAILVGRQWLHASEQRECTRAGTAVEQLWIGSRRDELSAAMQDTGVTFATPLVDRVLPWLDRHVEALAETTTEICTAHRVEERWDDDLHDRAAWCLDQRREELDALVDELIRADQNVLQHAVEASAGLAPVDPCRHEGLLRRLPPPPSDRREEIREVRARLSRVRALRGAGRYGEALALAEEALAAADSFPGAAIRPRAAFELGKLYAATGKYDQARPHLEQAYYDGAKVHAHMLMVDAATSLSQVTGYRLAKHEVGFLWASLAEIAMLELGEDPLREAQRLTALSTIYFDRGESEQALPLVERALVLLRETVGPEHPSVARSLTNVGTLLHKNGRYDEAAVRLTEGLDLLRRAVGPGHPEVGHALTALATSTLQLGKDEEALALHRQALEVLESAFGPIHPTVAMAYNNIGNVYQARGDYARAVPPLERSASITAENFGEDHPNLSIPLTNLATALITQGQYAAAIERLEQALSLAQKAYGETHPIIAIVLNNLADAHELQGAWPEAEALFEHSLKVAEASFGPEHPTLAKLWCEYGEGLAFRGEFQRAHDWYRRAREVFEAQPTPNPATYSMALTGLANAELGLGNSATAVELADAAMAQAADIQGPTAELAFARWIAGQARWSAGGNQAEARALVQQARPGFVAAGPFHARYIEAIDAWLASHPSG
ncbi:MAG: serine/threonine-protein kinase [Myxococcota bacterium]